MPQWTEKEIADLKRSYATEPTSRIAARLGRSAAAIRTKAEDLKLSKPRNISEAQRCWQPEQIALLCQLFPVTPTSELVSLFQRRESRIRSKAAELGLHKEVRTKHPRPEHLRLYHVNEQAFMNLNPRTAYVLGFILADGGLFIGKTQSKFLNITSKDTSLLEKIRDVLGSNHPIRTSGWSILTIVNSSLVDGLLALGITPNKSLTATLPTVSNELFPHLLRGYFDGDGYVRYGYRQGLTMKFTSGSRILLEQIADRVSATFHLLLRPVTNDKGRPNALRLHYHGITALQLADQMYENAGDLYLPRKRDIFERYRTSKRVSP